jgi:hypothetical protein
MIENVWAAAVANEKNAMNLAMACHHPSDVCAWLNF